MIEINDVTELDELESLKSEYLDRTTAPLDGMWLVGFLPLARHFSFVRDSKIIGYCCVNDEGYLLQFFLDRDNASESTTLFEKMISGKHELLPEIKGAFCSTAEPDYLSVCFDNFASFKVNAMMFQLNDCSRQSLTNSNNWALDVVESDSLNETVDFVLGNLDVPVAWLRPYLANLIQRKELFGCWRDNELIATGEHRKFNTVQHGYSEVGMIVGQDHRGKGLATWILQQLVQMAIANGLKPMCSAERDNIGSQKAISRAGFISQNRIIQFSA